MRTNFKILLFLVFTLSVVQSVAKKPQTVKYEILSAGSGVQGTSLVKVWVYDKSGKVSDEELKYGAVHGVIFRGFHGTQGMPSQSPIAKNVAVEQQKAEFFSAFFAENGPYLNFASIISESYERVRLAKKGYKVGAVISVNKTSLRKELEQAGVIQSLSNGF